MTHAPWYPWYPGDYAADPLVLGMSDAQDLAYRRLLDASWQLGALPSDPERLAVLARAPKDEFVERVWTYPLTECWAIRKDGLLINQRQEDEREKAFARSAQGYNAVKAREEKRHKRLKLKKKKPIIRGLSPDKRADEPASNSDPSPGEQPTLTLNTHTHTQNNTPSGRVVVGKDAPTTTSGATNDYVRWSAAEKNFLGPERKRLRDEIYERYLDDHGEAWIQAVWKSCRTWAMDHPKQIEARKSHYLFVLEWFRGDALKADARRKA